eukprot:SAG31_NODE_34972_length_327_cov_1.030702_1_plen_52_part_01
MRVVGTAALAAPEGQAQVYRSGSSRSKPRCAEPRCVYQRDMRANNSHLCRRS